MFNLAGAQVCFQVVLVSKHHRPYYYHCHLNSLNLRRNSKWRGGTVSWMNKSGNFTACTASSSSDMNLFYIEWMAILCYPA
ncbi:hypothetical protein AFLA_001692 [Aspergillus flavus NRRL3357]|nr:hypothetical protein AFLA_001692 [Aspergillus flavus NRRL3357]